MRNTKSTIIAVMALFVSLALATVGHAQVGGTPHSATLNCTAPSPVGGSGTVAGYNWYRTVPPSTTYTKITTSPLPSCNYKDSSVAPGTTYSYEATVVDSAGNESVGSAPIQGTIATNPNPPTAPTITLAQLIINSDGTENVLAKWTDAPGLGEIFHFSDGTKWLGQGLIAGSNVTSFAQTLPVSSGTAIWVEVCNPVACSSQQAM